MNVNTQVSLKSDVNYLRFLRENSYFYKYLNRNSSYFPSFKEEMKVKYKLTPVDKIDKFRKNIDKVSQLIDIFS